MKAANRNSVFKLRTNHFSAGILILALFLFNCHDKKKKPTPQEPATTFPKQEMLVNFADEIIVPSYNSFKISLDSLTQSFETFNTAKNSANLSHLRGKLHAAYLKYQGISLFGFGPAEDEALRVSLNIFPADTTLINKNISTGTYNLASASNIATKGFPALEFLFYGNGFSDDQLIAFYSSNNRAEYVRALLSDMRQKTNKVISSWTVYRNTFVNSLGTDISSSIGFLVNQMNYELDYLKNSKIGIPLGLKSDGMILPDNAESFYAGHSVRYLTETFDVIENVYRGRNRKGENKKGFDDYLDHLDAKRGSEKLTAAIDAQFTAARIKIAALSAPIHQLVVNNPTVVTAVHMELVKLLVLLKTDVPSSLGVMITYQDGDGD